MKIRKIEHNGVTIESYNDSGAEWVVNCCEIEEQRFPTGKWTQTEAIEFYKNTLDIHLTWEAEAPGM